MEPSNRNSTLTPLARLSRFEMNPSTQHGEKPATIGYNILTRGLESFGWNSNPAALSALGLHTLTAQPCAGTCTFARATAFANATRKLGYPGGGARLRRPLPRTETVINLHGPP